MDFNQQLLAALQSDPAKTLFEYKGRSYTRADIAGFAEQTIALIDQAQVPQSAKIGIVVRNKVLHAAAMLGLIIHGRALTAIYAMQSPEAIGAEVAESAFGAVIADAQDWSEPLRMAAKATTSAGIILTHEKDALPLAYVPELERAGGGPFSTLEGEQGLEVLSSGTTGKPKRIQFPFRMLVRAVESLKAARLDVSEPEVLTWPYGGIGGVCQLVGGVIVGRQSTILEKFNVPEWVEAVRRLRPKFLSGPPAVPRMILDAKVPKEDLASLQYFYGGSGPMPPELQTEFENTYGIKVIWAYGATEFCGTIITWTPDLYERYGVEKRGAMGCALPGIQLRVVDLDTLEPLPPNKVGYLSALVPDVKEDWITTTDLALIDDDGFVYHHGRGDGAIMRGGFKVIPEKVITALHSHPAVLDAAVVGVPDHRLGEVPVAAIELKAGATLPNEEELREHAKRELLSYCVPTRFLIVDSLPRTPSLKIDLKAVRRLFQEQ